MRRRPRPRRRGHSGRSSRWPGAWNR